MYKIKYLKAVYIDYLPLFSIYLSEPIYYNSIILKARLLRKFIKRTNVRKTIEKTEYI